MTSAGDEMDRRLAALLWGALLAKRQPEAAAAASEADEFFAERDARGFVERYRAAVAAPRQRTFPRQRGRADSGSQRRRRGVIAPAQAATLADAVARWGTPLYLTDLDAAAANLAAYRDAFPGALIAYAIKANPDPQLLRRFAAEGAGAEVVTAVELALARRAGIPADRIVMNGVGKRDEELHLALGAGVLINAESLEELGTLLRLAADHADARIGLRLNPALDARTHPHLATGAASSKFGIPDR